MDERLQLGRIGVRRGRPASGSGRRPGVTMLTRSSVVCADRTVATRSWNGLAKSRAHRSWAEPGYSPARRAAVSRARPFGVLGRATDFSGKRPAATGKAGLGIGGQRLAADTLPAVHRIEIKTEMGRGDVDAVQGLLDAAVAADAHAALDEHAWLDLVQGGRGGFAGLVAWEDGHDHPVGYAQVTRGAGSWALEFVVDPHHRVPGNTIGLDLVQAAIRIIAAEGGGHVHMWVNQPRPEHDRIAAVGRPGSRTGPLPDAPASAGTRGAAPRGPRRRCGTHHHPPVPGGPGRGRLAGGQQPGLSLAPRAGRLGPGHPGAAGRRAVVRSGRLPSPRGRRGSPRRVLLDEDPQGHRPAARRDLRDRGRSRADRSAAPGSAASWSWPAWTTCTGAGWAWGCCTATPTTSRRSSCTWIWVSSSTISTRPTSATFRRPHSGGHPCRS